MTEELTMTIQGMSCGHCVASVKKALSDVQGVDVKNVTVGSATVAYDPSRISPEQIGEAVSDAGYEASMSGANG